MPVPANRLTAPNRGLRVDGTLAASPTTSTNETCDMPRSGTSARPTVEGPRPVRSERLQGTGEISLHDAEVGAGGAPAAGEEHAAEVRVAGEEVLAVLDLAREVGRLGQREPLARQVNGRREHARERQAAEAAVERHHTRRLARHADGEPASVG